MVNSNNPLKNTSSWDIFNSIRHDLSSDFQARVPKATQANIAENMQNLISYRPRFNEFADQLVNKIGVSLTKVDAMWNNPLAIFKTSNMTFGDTIEEYGLGLLQAYTYNPDREAMEADIWGSNLPEMQSNFHRVNRQEKYKITVNQALIHRAFLTENGVASLVESFLAAPMKSDNWDEFLQAARLFAEYENNGGFYHMRIPQISSLSSTDVQSRQALRRMRALADTLPFLSTKYNAAHLPVHCNPEDLVIFTTPEFKAAVDVEALAGAFNMEKMDSYGRIITIPKQHFGIDHCEAIVTTKDFFIIADQLRENTSIFNPSTLSSNYWHHHWEIISASRFVPAVMFSTKFDDEVIVAVVAPTGISAITFAPDDTTGVTPTNVNRGDFVQLLASETGGPTGIDWSVTGANSNRTYITNEGVLHVGSDESATSLTVKAETTFIDPANPTNTPFSATLSVPVVGTIIPEWPDSHTDVHANDVRTVTDGVTTSGSATVTSATAAFTSTDVNATVSGAGIPSGTKVNTVNSATSVTLSANATATATGVTLTITPVIA